MLLEGKRAIVTGGSRGIGRAIFVEFARQGGDVVIDYFGEADKGYGRSSAVDEMVAEVEALGERSSVEGNIGDPRRPRALVPAAVTHFGGVDMLASNAGICPFHAFLDMPPELLHANGVDQSERRVLHLPGRGQPDEGPGHGWRDRRHQLDLRAGRRRHADALHADQGRRAFADAVDRHRAGAIRHPLQFGDAGRHRHRHQRGRSRPTRRSAPISTSASRSAVSAQPRGRRQGASPSSPPTWPPTSPALRCWSTAACSSICSSAGISKRRTQGVFDTMTPNTKIASGSHLPRRKRGRRRRLSSPEGRVIG